MMLYMHDKKFTNLLHINIINTDFNKSENLNSELKKAQHEKKSRLCIKISVTVSKIISSALIMNRARKTQNSFFTYIVSDLEKNQLNDDELTNSNDNHDHD